METSARGAREGGREGTREWVWCVGGRKNQAERFRLVQPKKWPSNLATCELGV